MRIDARRIAAATALAVLAGCSQEEPLLPSAHEVIVHALLDAGARDQYVFVQTTNGAFDEAKPVAGALVTLTLPDGRSLRADEERDSSRFITDNDEPRVTSAYRFSLDKLGFSIVPGGTYRLRVELPDARVVTGHTTVPNAVAISIMPPAQLFNYVRDTLSLAWPRVPGARSYEVSVNSGGDALHGPNRNPRAIFADTSIKLNSRTLEGSGDHDFFVRGYMHRLIVSAVDSNYYDYYRRTSDSFTGVGVIGHLAGALGVFGSIVEIDARMLDVR
ncbi:MAG: DUF4249 family protein [Gemmatimonadota bacterium]